MGYRHLMISDTMAPKADKLPDRELSNFIVTQKATRPAGNRTNCFYCNQPIGNKHLTSCVLINQMIRCEFTITIDIPWPAEWSEDNVNYKLNNSGWCLDNIYKYIDDKCKETECICPFTKGKYIKRIGEPFLDE